MSSLAMRDSKTRAAVERLWGRTRGPLAAIVLVAATVLYADILNSTYEISSWLFWPVLLLWGYNFALFAAFISAGHLLLHQVLKLQLKGLDSLALSIPTGIVAFYLLMHGLGALALLNLWGTSLLLVLMIASGAVPFGRFARGRLREWREAAVRENPSVGVRVLRALAGVFAVVCLGLLYLPMLTPDTINYDAGWYHLTVAQDYAREGRIVSFPADYTRNFPQLTPIVHTFGYIMPVPGSLQRWTLPLHTEFFIVLSTLVGIAAVIRHLVFPTITRYAWAGFFLFPSIFVYDLNIGGSADHFLALFCPVLFLAAARVGERNTLKDWLLFGILAGGATATKYQAVYMILATSPLLATPLVRHLWTSMRLPFLRRSSSPGPELTSPVAWKALLLYPLLGAGLAILVTSPHFIRNFVFYDNPVYPLAQGVLGGTPTLPDAAHQVDLYLEDYNSRPHGPLSQTLLESLRLVFTFSFEPHYSSTKNWPNFGGLFTLTLPLLLFVKRRGRIALATLVALLALLAWAITYRVDRNLQSIVPIIVASTTALLIRAWELGTLARVGTVAIVALQVIWGGDALFYSQEPRLNSAISIITSGYNGNLDTRDEFRKDYQDINAAAPDGAKILFHPGTHCLGINKTILSDLPGHQGLITYAGLSGPTAVKAYYESLGITHVVEELGAGAASARDEILFQEFVRSGPMKTFGRHGFLAVEDTHPRPDPENYQVFSMGISHYRNGIYPLDTMDTYKFRSPELVKYQRPKLPMPADLPARNALLARSHAALLAPRAVLSPEERQTLSTRFILVRAYGDMRVYLRR